ALTASSSRVSAPAAAMVTTAVIASRHAASTRVRPVSWRITSETVDGGIAPTEVLERVVERVRDGQPEIADRGHGRELEMPVPPRDAAAGDHHRQRSNGMLIRIAHPA